MPLSTVYVHGSGNKIAGDELKRVWDGALFERDMGDATRMACWAPLCHPRPLPGPDFDEMQMLPAPGPFESAVPATQAAEDFVAEAVAVARTHTDGGAAAPADRAAARLRAPSRSESGGPLAEAAGVLEPWLRRMTHRADALASGGGDPFEVLQLPRSMRTAAFRAMVRLAFRDAHAYFLGAAGEPIRDVVRASLRAADGPLVVIGHGLGSVIAYDVLREPEFERLDLALLLTAGSPLGVAEVQGLVARPLELPRAAAAWRNVCDGFDFLALDATLCPAFAPAERCADFLVRNASANHHDVREYLRGAAVREPVRALAERGSSSCRRPG